ncbi:hypothetical protein E3P93_02751 [Wallemia ichthyophaga]|nr:hypothetical protein E3P93_02751 [Wallemia ichthyophaga]
MWISAGKLTAAKEKRPGYSTRCLATQLRSGDFSHDQILPFPFPERGTKDTISHRIFICKRHNGQNHIKKKDYQDRHSVHLKSNTQKRTLSTSPLRVLQTAIDYIPKILR